MTRSRQLAVLVIAAALLTSACEAFEPSPGGSAAPGATPAGSVPPASGSIRTLAIAGFDSVAEGTYVRVVGLVSLPSSVTKVEGHYPLNLEDVASPGRDITAWVRVAATTPPPPNTMAELPSDYSSSDLLLTAEEGTALHDGDVVALTGIVKKGNSGSAYLDYVNRIEAAGETAGTGTPEPGTTATPAPRIVTIADFDAAADGEVVQVVGLIRTPGMASTFDNYCTLRLEDSTNPSRSISVEVRVSSASPPSPNMMADLPGSYKATDLLLTAEDGTAIHDGDGVALTGTVAKGSSGSASLDHVYRIEVAAVPLPKPVAVTFKTIKKQKADTLVRLTGRLDVGILTSCFGTCGIYLEDPASGASVLIEVTLGKKGERVPNTMWPLPSNYTRSSLRVIANDGRLLKGGVRVRVTGWITLGYKNRRQIDPVIRIDYAP